MGVDVSLEGVDKLLNRLELMGQKTTKVINPALQAAAEPILEDAKNTDAFEDITGHLRDVLKMSKVKTVGGVKSVWVGDVDGEAGYSWYVEFGHTNKSGNAPAHPFLQPAFENHKEEAKEIIKAKLREALESR